ncbi:MAG TPA: hypothetical protein VFL80_13100 [Thermoanaerobaculia bacterium]|nr:hypothetical protein [Thermoanaerobaculia bacterium]
MSKPLPTLLDLIRQRKAPRVILVGGSSDYLTERAFHEIRDAVLESIPGISVETFEPGTELAAILDSYRTFSLFASARLMVVPEVTAFVSAKEIDALREKAFSDWRGAKTDRKRNTAAAKLLHVLGLSGADLEMTDRAISSALGTAEPVLAEMLAFCRTTGKKAGRGEGDASLLMEAIVRGGAPSTILLMKTSEMPRESATVDLIDREGAVVIRDLTREEFAAALEGAVGEMAADAKVRFEPRALALLRQRLGIDRLLADKFSRDVPDLRVPISEAERLITLVGEGGRVSPDVVEREVAAVEGGARYELGSLFSEGKPVEALAKLRDLAAQARREDPRTSAEIHYGRFLFPLADELRQMISIRSYAEANGIDLRASIPYNRFKDTVAERLGEFMKQHGVVRQRPHPFPLHKKWEGAKRYSMEQLFQALADLADLDVSRKSGGVPADVAMEMFLLARR